MNKIVLISGKQGSGKTTIQKELFKRINESKRERAFIINFADPLYKMHDYCLGVLEDLGIKREIVKDGPLLQLLGTEWGRKTINENIWVNALHGQIKSIIDRQGRGLQCVFIVGDCRFENEFDGLPLALRVRLRCPEIVRKSRCSMWRENTNHPSEVGLDFYDEAEKFDMYFDTEKETVNHCATMVMAQLDKATWLEKRKI